MRISFVLFLASACADDVPVEMMPPETELRFVADASSASHAIQLEGAIDGTVLSVDVVGRDLGRVFGWSAHVVWDATILSFAEATVTGAVDAPTPEGRIEIIRSSDADLAIAETRTDRTLGDATLDGTRVLASIRFDMPIESETAIAIERVVVRDSAASFVPVESGGGQLVEMEVAR